MRCRMVADQRAGLLDHLVRDVGVQIERGDQRQIQADRRAGGAQDLAGCVFAALGRHRAMQYQQHAVERPGATQPHDQLVAQCRKHLVEHGAGRGRGRGRDQWDKRDTFCSRQIDRAADLGARARALRNDIFSAQQVAGREVQPRAGYGRETVRFLDDIAKCDTHE